MSEPPMRSVQRQRPIHKPGSVKGPQRMQNARHGSSGYIGGFGTGEDGGQGFRAFDKKQDMSTEPDRAEHEKGEDDKQNFDQNNSLKQQEAKQGIV